MDKESLINGYASVELPFENEGEYVFDLIQMGEKGFPSIPQEVIGKVYGDKYISSLIPRSARSVDIENNVATLTIGSVDNCYYSEVLYTDNNGKDNNNNNNNSDNNESNTTEDVVIPPKPEENNPSKIEETGDDDIIYFDEHGNSYTIPNSPKSQETTEEKITLSKVQGTIENTKEEEKTTIEENEEVPSFETPTEIEEEKSSITEEKEQYIALREAITSELAQNNVETENMEESQVLTYRM